MDEENKTVHVDELFLVPQFVSGSEVDFVSEGIPYALEKAKRDGRLTDLRFCIHSHGTHGAFWSNVDEDAIEKFGWGGTPWFANAIFNKRGDTAGRIDLWHNLPILGRQQFTLKDVDVLRPGSARDLDEARAELAEFVTERKYVVKKNTPGKKIVVGAPSNGTIKPNQQTEAPPTVGGEVVGKGTYENVPEPEMIDMLKDIQKEAGDLTKLTIAKAKQLASDWHMDYFSDNNGQTYVMGFNGCVFLTFDRGGKLIPEASEIQVPVADEVPDLVDPAMLAAMF
jgi:hypothetical protein